MLSDQQKKQHLPASDLTSSDDKPIRRDTHMQNRDEHSRTEEKSRRATKNQNEGQQRAEFQINTEKAKEEKSRRESSPHVRENKQVGRQHQNQHQQQHQQQQQQQQHRQQNPGYGRGKGQKGRYEDTRHSLPPRLQKRQQQQRQQQQQQQQQQQSNNGETYHGNKTNSPLLSRKSNSPSVMEGEDRENLNQESKQSSQNKQSNKSTGENFSKGKRQKNQRQQQNSEYVRETKKQPEQNKEEFIAQEIPQQENVDTPNGTSDSSYATDTMSRQMQNTREVFIAPEYNYQGPTQAPMQPYPVYQFRPPQIAQLRPAAQQQVLQPQQAVPAQMTTAQVRHLRSSALPVCLSV